MEIIVTLLLALLFMRLSRSEGSRTYYTGKKSSNKIARILCSTGCSDNMVEFVNIRNCAVAAAEFPSAFRCPSACLGFNSCIEVCPENAISMEMIVDPARCRGCGICAEICPSGVIGLWNRGHSPYIACRTFLDASEIEEYCFSGCVRCYICIDVCSRRAISLDDNGLPVIDYSKCDGCERCVFKCPIGVIRR